MINAPFFIETAFKGCMGSFLNIWQIILILNKEIKYQSCALSELYTGWEFVISNGCESNCKRALSLREWNSRFEFLESAVFFNKDIFQHEIFAHVFNYNIENLFQVYFAYMGFLLPWAMTFTLRTLVDVEPRLFIL